MRQIDSECDMNRYRSYRQLTNRYSDTGLRHKVTVKQVTLPQERQIDETKRIPIDSCYSTRRTCNCCLEDSTAATSFQNPRLPGFARLYSVAFLTVLPLLRNLLHLLELLLLVTAENFAKLLLTSIQVAVYAGLTGALSTATRSPSKKSTKSF